MSERVKRNFYDIKHQKEYGSKAVYLNPNPEHYHQKILKIIEEQGKARNLKILDVGCATGYLGAAIKRKGKHRVYGIEISEIAIKKARKVLDDVVCADIESIEIPWQEKFDIIILSDILEHLFDPKRVLVKIKKHLEPYGRILSTMPNVANYRIRLMLMRGKWLYQDTGSLDYGHLRFFTKESTVIMFKESGYEVIQVIPWIPLLTDSVDRRLSRILLAILKRVSDTLFAQSFLYVAKLVQSNA